MTVVDFRRHRTAAPVFARLSSSAPEIVAAARSFHQRCAGLGTRLSFTDAGIARLEQLLADPQAHEPLGDSEAIVRGAGAFLGCHAVACIGGSWQPDETSWLVADIGDRGFSFDPFDTVHLVLAGGSGTSLARELAELRDDACAKGPRTRFEQLFEETFERITGRSPGARARGFTYRTDLDEWVFLHNIYRRAGADTDAWPDEIENFVRKLEGAALERPLLKGDIGERIFPALKRRGEAAGRSARRLVQLPLVDDLVLVFAVDFMRSMSFVTEAQTALWGWRKPELRELALANLGKRNFGLQVDVGRGVVTVNENDGYDAVRVLLPGFPEALARALGTEIHVAIPHRDLLVAFAPGHACAPAVRSEISTLSRSRPYGLSALPFRLAGTQLERVAVE